MSFTAQKWAVFQKLIEQSLMFTLGYNDARVLWCKNELLERSCTTQPKGLNNFK